MEKVNAKFSIAMQCNALMQVSSSRRLLLVNFHKPIEIQRYQFVCRHFEIILSYSEISKLTGKVSSRSSSVVVGEDLESTKKILLQSILQQKTGILTI